MRVLVVDSSVSFRTQISKALDGMDGVECVGTAAHGKLALKMIGELAPDLVLLELDLPVMDGFELLTELKAHRSLQCLVFATRTAHMARDSVKAMRLGAADFIPKPLHALPGEDASELIAEALENPLRALRGKAPRERILPPVVEAAPPSEPKPISRPKNTSLKPPSIIVIASSTGGPPALDKLLAKDSLRQPNCPVFIAQHMPADFTRSLAQALSQSSGLICREATNGELAQSGVIYLAPGDYHMRLQLDASGLRIQLDQGPRLHGVRPAADYLFQSAADIFGEHSCGLVLSGMGEDGKEGARRIKEAGGRIYIQDRETCAVWGMPGSVHSIGAYDAMLSIQDCSQLLRKFWGTRGEAA